MAKYRFSDLPTLGAFATGHRVAPFFHRGYTMSDTLPGTVHEVAPGVRVRIVDIDEAIPDSHNANKGTPRGNAMLAESIERFGAGRGILLDKNLKTIGGNKTLAQCKAAGISQLVLIETEGQLLVATKRDDLDIETPEGRTLAYVDNRLSEVNYDLDGERLLADMQGGIDFVPFWTPVEIQEIQVEIQPVEVDLGGEDASAEAGDAESSTYHCPKCGFSFRVDA